MFYKIFFKLYFILIVILFFPVSVFTQESNDPFYYQWAYNDIGVYEAWEYTTGSDKVVVAIIDNGFDTFHPDLLANAWKNIDEIPNNKIDDDKNGYIDDVWGWNFADSNNDPRPQVDNLSDNEKGEHIFSHGTMVAGLIGAVGNNNKDGVGINWKVKLMNLKVLGNNGSGNLDTIDDAIRYAVDNGADVINISMVGYYTEDMKRAIDYAYENGVVVVAAAGNNSFSLNDNTLYPICIDKGSDVQKVLGVSAITQEHKLTTFSNIGSDCIDLTAPGSSISSTVRFSPTNGLPNRYLGGWQGTSFATPMVSGAAALIKSIQPAWGSVEIYQAILSTVHHTPSADEAGYAELFGAGMLQIDEAVRYAIGSIVNGGWEKIVSYQAKSGLASVRDVDNNEIEENLNYLSGADGVFSYKQNGGKYFAITKQVDGVSKVFILNEKGKEIIKWNVVGGGKYNIVVGDLIGDSQVEIILSPQDKSKSLFKIFDFNGVELSAYNLENQHSGVDLAIVPYGGQNQVVAYYKETELIIARFDVKAKLQSSFTIDSYIKNRGEIIVGDFDGDNTNEYVVTGDENDLPFLLFYEKSGELIRHFYAYSPSYRGVLDIESLDFDNDKQDEVAVLAVKGDQSARIWRFEGKKSEVWWPFDEDNKEDLRLLVY